MMQLTEQIIKTTAEDVQAANTTLNNYAGLMNDPEREEKLAFAIGMTSNMGKMRMSFNEDTTEKKAIEKKVPVINKSYIKKEAIKYLPHSVKRIAYFDTLFNKKLQQNKLKIEYKLHAVLTDDKRTSRYEYVSAPFIINFYNPDVYRVDYNILLQSILPGVLPYISITLALLLMVVGAFIFYYRSYVLQWQTAQFKESLFSNITHELKTPLSSLQLVLDISQKEGAAILSKQHVDFAQSEINRMQLIIDKILSFGKMSAEQFALNKERVNMDAVITNAIQITDIALQQAGGSIHYTPVNNATVTGDKTLLTNTIATLIDNAIKYNNTAPHITINLSAGNRKIVISIQDNGIGIAPAYHKKIFEPFFRIPTGNVHNVKGHGLGLSFTAQVLQLHGGHIGVAAAQDGGSIFIIELPQ